MYKEIISPNVKKILPALGLSFPIQLQEATLHKNGIIVLDTNLDALEVVERAWDRYSSADAVYPVGVTGLPEMGGRIGSKRFCAWDEGFAEALSRVIRSAGVLEMIQTPGYDFELFEAVSKYFRFMRYSAGGEHFPHYDSDFTVQTWSSDVYATRYSLVAFFNSWDSGELAFVNSPSENCDDWARQATDAEIYLKIKPKAGTIVLFPHSLCHTVLPFTETWGARYVVRGDLIFTPFHSPEVGNDY